MKIPKETTRQSTRRKQLELEVLNAYNRKRKKLSPSEAKESVADEFDLLVHQVEYIVYKARHQGKKVL